MNITGKNNGTGCMEVFNVIDYDLKNNKLPIHTKLYSLSNKGYNNITIIPDENHKNFYNLVILNVDSYAMIEFLSINISIYNGYYA